MNPRLTEHVRARMRQRGISELEIREVLLNHDTTMPADNGTKYVGNVGGRRIAVVATSTAIITAFQVS